MSMRFRFSLGVAVALALIAAVSTSAFAQKATITFLHINDVYELSPKQGKGGFAPLMTLLKQERAKEPTAITTLGGDLIASSMMSGITKGTQMIELTNAVGVDLAVIGNHELDFGPEIFKQRMAESRYPWLGTNVLDTDGKIWGQLLGTWTRKVGDITVGFFGVLTPDTEVLSAPGPTIKFASVIETSRAAVKQLRDAGADLVVAMTHMYLRDDREIVREVKGIDVMLGGHDHDPIAIFEGGTLILKSGFDGHYLGVAHIEVEKTQGQRGPQVRVLPREWRLVSTAGVAPDPQIAAMVKVHEDKLDKELLVEIGKTAVALDSRRAAVRRQETAIGNMMSDAIREWTKADAAITNGGGIRGDRIYEAGTTLTRKDVLTELPFGNLTTLMTISGADLRMALEESLSQVEDLAGRFPHLSGMKLVFDARRPKMNRIVSVEVGGKPLDPQATYKLAANEYIAAGGDGYLSLKKGKSIIDANAAPLMATVVMDYIQAKGSISPAVEGRIIEQR